MKLIFSFILSLLIASQSFAGMISSPKSVSYWGLDGNFNDSKGAHHATAVGNAQIDTAQSKFGGASGLFDGVGDYLTVPDSDDWNFGGGAFAIDLWVRYTNYSGWQALIGQGSGGNTDRYYLATNGSSLVFDSFNSGSAFASFERAWVPSLNVWYHVALTRSIDDWRMLVNGVQLGATYVKAGSFNNYAGIMAIGSETDAQSFFYGWMDEIAIYKTALKSSSDIRRRMLNMHPIGGH